MSDLNPDDISWSKTLFQGMRVGGVWGVPRSGLVFTKTDDKTLKLTSRMPFADEMPGTPVELEVYQDMDYEVIKRHFEAAGVEVVR